VAYDLAEYFLGQPPSSNLDISERSLKHWMEHLIGKGVGDDGPYFAIVETSLEVVKPDADP